VGRPCRVAAHSLVAATSPCTPRPGHRQVLVRSLGRDRSTSAAPRSSVARSSDAAGQLMVMGRGLHQAPKVEGGVGAKRGAKFAMHVPKARKGLRVARLDWEYQAARLE
jgi:hypothetical protein